MRAPSLDHHIADKNPILGAIARTIVATAGLPRKPASDDWPEWFTQLTLK